MANNKMSIRFSNTSDLDEIQQLFIDTISTVCKNDYSPEQIRAWTSSIENKLRWTNKLSSQYFLIAELDNKIVGYASLEHNDYLDLLYVHKDYQRQGIANRLFTEIEKEAVSKKTVHLYSDVSKTAKGFFEKKGFNVMKSQTHNIQGIEIINYKMIKQL